MCIIHVHAANMLHAYTQFNIYTVCVYNCITDQSFPDRVVSMSEVREELCYNGLSIGVVTHGIEEVDSLLTDTDISLRLERGGGAEYEYSNVLQKELMVTITIHTHVHVHV